MPTRRTIATLALAGFASVALAAPADKLPDPRPEKCIQFAGDPGEEGMVAAAGLSYEQVRMALNGVIQTALYCGQPEGISEVHLTFEMLVGCDGVVSKIEAADTGGAPADYVQCISDVIKKADFDAHDLPDGQEVTYPVNVAW